MNMRAERALRDAGGEAGIRDWGLVWVAKFDSR